MAVYGIRIWNPDLGTYTLTPNDRVSRIVGHVNTGTSNGQLAVNLSEGEPFYFIVPDLAASGPFVNIHVTISSSQVAWAFEYTGDRKPFDIFYGLY